MLSTAHILPDDYLALLERVGDRFQHCMSVSAIHLPDQPLVYVNSKFELDTGYSRDDCLGRNCRFLQGRLDSQPARRDIAVAISEGRSVFSDLVNFRKDGKPFINRLVLLPFEYISSPNERYYIGIQRVMGHTDEVSSTSFQPKAGEIDHEINNPLAVALGFAELGGAEVELIDAAIERIEAYVDQL